MKRELLQYIRANVKTATRKRRDGEEETARVPYGHRRGAFIARQNQDGDVGIGWSLCCKKDRFDRELAKNMARGRSVKNGVAPPHSIREQLELFRLRAARFFKTKNIHIPGEKSLWSKRPNVIAQD